MTLTDVRDAIVTRTIDGYSAVFPDIPLVFENTPFDYNNPPEMFTEVEIEFHDGNQIGVAVNPKTRYAGCVYVTVTTREGKGTRAALAVLDWMASHLGYYQTLRLHLLEPKPRKSSAPKGWNSQGLKVEFYSNPA